MSKHSREDLARQLSALHAAIDNLRTMLLTFRESTEQFITLVEEGEAVLPALRRIEWRELRPDLAEALELFEATRQRARVGILALGRAQGATLSEIGRQLGISRQFASHLAALAEKTESPPGTGSAEDASTGA